MTRQIRRQVGGLSLGAGAFVAAAAVGAVSVAFACTDIMGALSLTPTSGNAGSVVTTSASGLKIFPAKYQLHLTKSTSVSADCMSFRGVFVLGTITTNMQGAWSNVTVTIPSTAKVGTHGLCGMETYPVKGGTGTVHDTFTVT